MASVQTRESDQTRDRLQRIADTRHEPVGVIVEQAVKQFDNTLFWSTFHEQLGALRSDPVAWREVNDELREFDGTLLDGLDDEADEADEAGEAGEADEAGELPYRRIPLRGRSGW